VLWIDVKRFQIAADIRTCSVTWCHSTVTTFHTRAGLIQPSAVSLISNGCRAVVLIVRGKYRQLWLLNRMLLIG